RSRARRPVGGGSASVSTGLGIPPARSTRRRPATPPPRSPAALRPWGSPRIRSCGPHLARRGLRRGGRWIPTRNEIRAAGLDQGQCHAVVQCQLADQSGRCRLESAARRRHLLAVYQGAPLRGGAPPPHRAASSVAGGSATAPAPQECPTG